MWLFRAYTASEALMSRSVSHRRLLAKSYNKKQYSSGPPDYALLLQHSRDVAEACEAISNAIGRIALLNAGLRENTYEHFCRALQCNGWIQDTGKASSHFQIMVSVNPEIRQLLRHETISGLLFWFNDRLRDWLSPLGEYVIYAIWGAIGHHRKFDYRSSPEQVEPLTVQVSHEDFAELLRQMGKDLGLGAPPQFERDIVIVRDCKEKGDRIALELVREMQDDFANLEPEFMDESKRRMLALIKGFGIAADVAASAIAARGKWASNYSISDYIKHSLTQGSLVPDDLTRLIHKWAWDQPGFAAEEYDLTTLPPNFVIREFQANVAASKSMLTLAQAGCGSGKSLAAYLWAREWSKTLASQGRNCFRLIFCLPTTGTTTEHFKDYALESGIEASLTHSRALVDLLMIAETAPQEEATAESSNAAEAARIALNAERDKLESLALWSTPLIVTTADTVLGLMANARRSIYSLPAIMSGVIVFDEVHAFDEHLFGHLLIFLKHFPHLPVLLMTASLPEARLRAISAVRPDLEIVPGPPGFETLERYILDIDTNDEEIWERIKDCIDAGGKVLWVKNRVEWANSVYFECQSRFPQITVDIYHSRLRYKDRSHRHRRVIDRFKRNGEPSILVATQVAEMSLNLSADLLITDVAPIPSLIQRLGRLNRRATPDNPLSPKEAIISPLPVNEKNAELPYEASDLARSAKWLKLLIEKQQSERRALSQRDLSEAFAAQDNADEFDIAKAEQRACFFSGLWQTRPGLTRDESHTVSVVLESDLENCVERDDQGMPKQEWLRQHEVSIPFREEVMNWKRIGALRVAPRDRIGYDFNETNKEGVGARWLKN